MAACRSGQWCIRANVLKVSDERREVSEERVPFLLFLPLDLVLEDIKCGAIVVSPTILRPATLRPMCLLRWTE